MTSPNFHGWVIGASHPAGVAADWLTSAWGQMSGFADPAPASAAVEEVAAGWVLDLLGLPAAAGVGFCTGATMANFTALAAARGELLRRAGWDVEAKGLFGAPEVHVVLGGEAHSSVYLSLRLLGFGAERVHVAAADGEGRMRPDGAGGGAGGAGGADGGLPAGGERGERGVRSVRGADPAGAGARAPGCMWTERSGSGPARRRGWRR